MIGQLYPRTTVNQSLLMLILFTDAKLFRHRLVPILPVLYGVVNFKFMIIDLLHITLRRSCWFRVNLLSFRPRERERTQYTTIAED